MGSRLIIACHEVDTMAVGNNRVNLVVVPVVEPVLGAIVQPRGIAHIGARRVASGSHPR